MPVFELNEEALSKNCWKFYKYILLLANLLMEFPRTTWGEMINLVVPHLPKKIIVPIRLPQEVVK
jgi:hypothetical protein